MPRGRRAGRGGGRRRTRISSSDEEDSVENVSPSQFSQVSNSQASQRRFASGQNTSQDSERRRRAPAHSLTDEEIDKLAHDVAGFLMDHDQRVSSPLTRALIIKHAVLPENMQHYRRIVSRAETLLGKLGANFHVSSANMNSLILKYDLPAIEFDPDGNTQESDVFEATVRKLLLGLILLHDGGSVPDGELKSHWMRMKLEGYSVADSKGTTTLAYDNFIKSRMLDPLYLEKKCVTDEETHVKENWYSWGPRAEAEVPRVEAIVAVCAVMRMDPDRSEQFRDYLQEWHDKFAYGRTLSVADAQRMAAERQRVTPLNSDTDDVEDE